MNNIFYHISTINDFYERFLKTFNKVINSNLINNIDTFYVSLNGDKSLIEKFKIHPKIKVINLSKNFPNEGLTTNYLRKFAIENPNGNTLYLHSKGITKRPEEIENVNAWVDYMEYFLIEKWGNCIEILKNKNTVGTEMKTPPVAKYHYCGNFWWAKNNYLSKLPECDITDYYAPENWVLSLGQEDTYFNFFSSKLNLYQSKINTIIYKSMFDIQDIKEEIKKLGSDSVKMFDGQFEGGIYLQQNLDEISETIDFLLKNNHKFENLLEVGAAAGGNSKVFSLFLNIKNIRIIDDNNHSKHIYRKEVLKNLDVEEFVGNSQSKEAFEWIKNKNEKYDIVYIDADHSYEGVKNDINNYYKFVKNGGFIIFHDHISPIYGQFISRAIEEFLESNENFKKVFSSEYKFGICVLQNKLT
jgi:predicted O-methyltransferase YrrM